jgi:hypothetical protein
VVLLEDKQVSFGDDKQVEGEFSEDSEGDFWAFSGTAEFDKIGSFWDISSSMFIGTFFSSR